MYIENLKDVLECRRVMVYNGEILEYTTGLNDIYLNAHDVLHIMQNTNDFGYLQDMFDLVHLLTKHNCLSKAMLVYEPIAIANYLSDNNIPIDMIIEIANKCKSNKFKSFLIEAKDIINKYGLYVPEPKIKHYDKRNNNEKNLAHTFDLNALNIAAYNLNVYEDNLYLDIVNIVTNIVFNTDIESLRYSLNMMYDDYLSDYITEYEYDLVAYCCRVISYMLRYSDIGVYGLEIFIRGVLEVALKDFDRNKYKSKERSGSVIEDIFDRAMTGDLDYDPNVIMSERKQVSDEDIEDFKKYL